MSKELPKTIYGAWTEYENDDPAFIIHEEPTHHAELDDEVTVGIYELVGTRQIVNMTVIENPKLKEGDEIKT